jgi:outer membrane protein OmpA-like peptidoglycan-associated protein
LKGEKMKRHVVFLIIASFVISGCANLQTKTEKGAAYGAAGGAVAGAIVGQLVGRDAKGTVIGAAVGAAVGGLAGAGVGKMMDNQERDLRQSLANSEAATVRREGNLLAITFKGDVMFDFNSAVVRPGLYPEINKIADAMNQYPDTVARIEGHTDSIGSETYNMELSIRRASAVRDLLLQRGVAATRLETVGFGETIPIASNDTEAGRLQNRRVEIKIAPSTQ